MEIKQRLLSILNTAFNSQGSDAGHNEIVYYCPFFNVLIFLTKLINKG